LPTFIEDRAGQQILGATSGNDTHVLQNGGAANRSI
jgi:hypothetical protein